MDLLIPTNDSAEVTIAAAVAALPFPPVAVGVVPASWTHGPKEGVIPEWDLKLIGAAALNLTAGEVYAGELQALVFADKALDSVTFGTDTITEAAHGLETGDGPVRFTSSGALPTGIVAGVNYWVIRVDANNFKIASSFASAWAGTAVDFTDAGSGTHTLADVDGETKRVYFYRTEVLPTPIALDARKGFRALSLEHRSEHVCYAVVGTPSASTVTATMVPTLRKDA